MQTTIDHRRLAAISRLDEGGHDETENAMCVMEAAAWVAHEPWSDHPACVCPVIAACARALNDRLPDGQRQRLIPLIPAMIDHQELTFGDFTTGRYGWLLHGVVSLPEPIPARGELGIWTWDAPEGLVAA